MNSIHCDDYSDGKNNTNSVTPLPATSLTICSRNRPKLLLETIVSVLEGIEVPSEIIVVDQSDMPHPTLSTMGPVKKCEIRYFHIQSLGVSKARNMAIQAARYDIVVLTDDDMFVEPTWLGTLVRALLAAGPRSVVSGQVRPGEPEVAGGFAPSTNIQTTPIVYQGRIGKDVLFTGNMAMHRSVLNDIGAFDERLGTGARFPAAYDNDFGFRLLETGYRIHYIPNAILYHRAWRSGRDYARLHWNYGRGQGAFYAKHVGLRNHYVLRRMVANLGVYSRNLLCHLRHTPERSYSDLSYIAGFLSAVGEWLVTEKFR